MEHNVVVSNEARGLICRMCDWVHVFYTGEYPDDLAKIAADHERIAAAEDDLRSAYNWEFD